MTSHTQFVISMTMTVPAVVPSLFQSLLAALKKTVPLTSVSQLGVPMVVCESVLVQPGPPNVVAGGDWYVGSRPLGPCGQELAVVDALADVLLPAVKAQVTRAGVSPVHLGPATR